MFSMERYLKSPPNFLFVTAFTLTTPEKKKTRGGEKNNQETIIPRATQAEPERRVRTNILSFGGL